MKIGFWTTGMPDWSNAEFAKRASELGYDGIVLRRANLGEHGVNAVDQELDEIKRTYESAGIEIECLISSNSKGTYPGCGSDEIDWDQVEGELVHDVRAANKLGCPTVMVPVQRPVKGVRWDWTEYLDNLARASLAALKEAPDVSAIYENHVDSASARQLLEMVERTGDQRLGVMFSPDHCVVMQENAVELADRYASGIRQVCLADRKVVEEDLGNFDGRYYYVRYECCVVGEGIVPSAAILTTLKRHGYDGYVTLKWEKHIGWAGAHLPEGFGHHLPDGEVVLPSFVEYVRSLGVL
jgi:sugar phosphate isomerase/epimerase